MKHYHLIKSATEGLNILKRNGIFSPIIFKSLNQILNMFK